MKQKKQEAYKQPEVPFSSKRILVAMRNQLRKGCSKLSDSDRKLPRKVRKTLYLVLFLLGLIGNSLLAYVSLTG